MKPDYQIKNVKLYCCDNMEFMEQVPDNYYNLAIVDPEYGIGMDGGKIGGDNAGEAKKYTKKEWDSKIPDDFYFAELKRISKHQIIWGVNYFKNLQGGRIVWNKDNTGNFSDCELAYQSFTTSVRMVKIRWNGMLQQNMKEKETRIHPTQKPVSLYKWILQKYAKPGDKIFDSHGGSFSSACACLDMGFDFDGCEIDREYFDNAVERLKNNVQEYLDFT